MDIHIYHHIDHTADPVLQRLGEMDAKLVQLLAQGVSNMAEVTAQMKQVLDAIDTATNEAADRVIALMEKAAESMDESEAAPLLEQAKAISDRLKGIAADPATPVPVG